MDKLKPLPNRKGLPPSPNTIYQRTLKFVSNLPLIHGIITKEMNKKKEEIIHGGLKEIGNVKPLKNLK